MTSLPGEHAITDVATRCVAVPFETVLRTATSGFDAAYLVLTDVTTAGGAAGIGWTFGFSSAHTHALEHLIRHAARSIIGRSALDVAARWSDMRRGMERPGVVGSGSMAIAAIDIALWDLLGHVAGLPVATLLGGHRRQVESYNSFGLWSDMSQDELVRDAQGIVDGGSKAMKMRVGGRSATDELDRVGAVRSSVPDDVQLMLDANSAWSAIEAETICQGLAEHRLTWIEDPTPSSAARDPGRARAPLPIPVCGGEDAYFPDGLDVAMAFPYDIAMLDVFRVGGITGFAKLSTVLALQGTPVTPHLDTVTGLHLVAGLENARWVEFLPWWGSLFREWPAVEDGMITVADAPGLGLAWSDQLDRFGI